MKNFKLLFLFLISFSFNLYSFENNNVQYDCKFIENKGQYPANVLFYSKAKGYEVYLTKTGLYYNLSQIENGVKTGQVVAMNFQNSNNPEFVVDKSSASPTKRNYFIGSDSKKWVTDVKEYEVTYLKNTWNGIDVKFYFDNGKLRYDFEVNKGANPKEIQLQFNGADAIQIASNGELNLTTKFGNLTHGDLKSFTNTKVDSKFVIQNGNSIAFELGNYDKTKKLIIDPIITTSILNGNGDQEATSILNLADTAFLVTGWTSSSNFTTTTGAYQNIYSSMIDSYIHRYDVKVGQYQLTYSTYLGGAGEDKTIGIKMDADDNIYVGGNTNSSDYPIVKGFGSVYKAQRDVFVTKFKKNFSGIDYSGLITGSNDDYAMSMTLRGRNVFIVGQTRSSDFPIKFAKYSTYKNNGDGFYTKINEAGTSYDFSSFIGGLEEDVVNGISVDATGDILLSGSTKSTDFPVFPNSGGTTPDRSYDIGHNGNWDAFLVKIDNSGNTVVFATFYGGSEDDFGVAGFNGTDGQPYIVGYTKKETTVMFPKSNGSYQQTNKGGFDVFIGKMTNIIKVNLGGFGNPSAFRQNLIFNTFAGGTSDDVPTSAILNPVTQVISISGKTQSADFPVAGMASRKHSGGDDAFYLEMNNAGTSLANSSLFGGIGDDVISSFAIDATGDIYLAGNTTSGNMIGVSSATVGNTTPNAFISKYTFGTLTTSSPNNGQKVCAGTDIQINWTSQNIVGGLELYYALKNTTNFTYIDKVETGNSSKWSIPANIPAGDYYIRVVNKSGLSSNSGNFIVQATPVFINFTSTASSTTNAIVCEGQPVQIIANASNGTGSFIWKKDGQIVPSATSATLTVNAASPLMAGDYEVAVVGACAPNANSPKFKLSVSPKIAVTTQLVNATTEEGTLVTISFDHSGVVDNYSWLKNGQIIAGKTGKSLQVGAVMADAGKYKCLIERTGDCPSLDSTIEAVVTVTPRTSVRDIDETLTTIEQNNNELSLGLNLTNEANVKVSMLSANGNEMGVYFIGKASVNQKVTIDIAKFNSGVYFLMLQLNEETFVRKISIVK